MDAGTIARTAGTPAPAHERGPDQGKAARTPRVAACSVCGHQDAKGHIGSPRSVEQLRRYFKVIRVAFHHWPETSERQFSNEEELRAWAQMKAGYRDIAARIPLVGMNRERALMLVEASIRAAGSYAMPVLHKDELVIFKPRSISFAKLAHSDFCKLNEAVESVIAQKIGIPVEMLLKEHERAA